MMVAKWKQLVVVTYLVVGAATLGLANPTWMGVYSDFQRHDGDNPGTFTILMNRDLWGLQAEVGFQVDGGSWQTLPMQYAGQVDGNSIWTVTPDAAFAAGATVSYYFHGWYNDHHIWDSQNGQNYHFEVPAGGAAAFSFDDGRFAPVGMYSAKDGDRLFVLEIGDQSLILHRSLLPHGDWENLGTLAHTESFVFNPRVAVRDAHVAVIYGDGQTKLYTRLSTDGGATFAVPRAFPAGTHPLALDFTPQGDLLVLSVESGPEGLRLFTRTSADQGQQWSDPSVIAQYPPSEPSLFPGLMVRMSGDAQHILVAHSYSEVDVRAFGSGRLRVATSANGQHWQSETLGEFQVIRGNTLHFDVLAGSDGAYIAGSKTPESMLDGDQAPIVWRRGPSGWTTTRLADVSSSDRVFLREGPAGALTFVNKNISLSDGYYFLSLNGGQSFSQRQTLRLPSALGGSTQILQAHGASDGLYLLWRGVNPELNMAAHSLQRGTLTAVESLELVGPSSHWPENGVLQVGDDLWISTATYPAGSAARVRVVYSNGGEHWYSTDLDRTGTTDGWDTWSVNLGSFFAAGETIYYAVEGVSGDGESVWDNNGGQDYRATVDGGNRVPVEWIGNTFHWPSSGQVHGGDTVWINTQTWPGQTAADVYVVYSINGGEWTFDRLHHGQYANNNDHWYLSLGQYPAGTHIRYAVAVFDSFGNQLWDNNNSQDYVIQINQ